MLRVDLVVNNLLACAVATGEIRIMSDGSPWRPLIHCRDIARAFVAFMKAPKAAHPQHGRQCRRQYGKLSGPRRWLIRSRNWSRAPKSLILAKSVPIRAIIASNSICSTSCCPISSYSTILPSGMEELHRKLIDHGFNKTRLGRRSIRAAAFLEAAISIFLRWRSSLDPQSLMTECLCRFCRTPLSRTFADLGVSPVANAFLRPDQLNAMEPFFPLHAYVCEGCFLVQLEDFETSRAYL